MVIFAKIGVKKIMDESVGGNLNAVSGHVILSTSR